MVGLRPTFLGVMDSDRAVMAASPDRTGGRLAEGVAPHAFLQLRSLTAAILTGWPVPIRMVSAEVGRDF